MNISYRKVDLTNSEEMQFIATIDMSIPVLFDSKFEVNEKTIAERLSQLLKCKPDDFFEVAFSEEGKIIGYHFVDKFKTPHGVMAADINTLWVDPQFRKKGIAKTLKLRSEAWARQENLDHISTFVHAKNLSMQSLNQNLEYELVGYKLRKNLK